MSQKLLYILCAVFLTTACGQKQPQAANAQEEVASTTAPPQPKQPAPSPKPAPTEGNLRGRVSGMSGNVSNLNFEITLNADVMFDFDKSDIKQEAFPILADAVNTLKEKKASLISITGHTDAKGTDAYNDRLSLQRAESVKQWFLANGLPIAIETKGAGSKEPIAENTKADGSDNPAGRAKNRRVLIKILKVESL